MKAALKALSFIWREGYCYKKSGVVLLDLTLTSAIQETLFVAVDDVASKARM